jgi:hypothetical protein
LDTLLRLPLLGKKDQLSLLKLVENSIRKYLRNLKVKLNRPEAEVIKTLAWLDEVKAEIIHDPNAADLPYMLDSVAYTRDLDNTYVSPLALYISDYLDSDVYKYTGISFTDYLKLPMDVSRTLDEMLALHKAKLDSLSKEIEEELRTNNVDLPDELKGFMPWS